MLKEMFAIESALLFQEAGQVERWHATENLAALRCGGLRASVRDPRDSSAFNGSGFVPGGCGVVFKLDPTGKETVLQRFTGGADGADLVSLFWKEGGTQADAPAEWCPSSSFRKHMNPASVGTGALAAEKSFAFRRL